MFTMPSRLAQAISKVQTQQWPNNCRFAFSIFDDPDQQVTADGREVYALLTDLGFRTTRGVWPLPPTSPAGADGHCGQPEHVEWLLQLQQRGFELGFHNATMHTSTREQTRLALEHFRDYFGSYPLTAANHYENEEAIYWGSSRLSGWRRLVYNAATKGSNHNRFHGHEPGHELFWGDYCRQHIRYVRNFVFREIDTLSACPFMPYHDPLRPFVHFWYASSEGGSRDSFNDCLSERNQDLLEERGSACIMYAHFGNGFVVNGKLDPRFREVMTRLSRKPGWFVPVATLLDYLRSVKGERIISDKERRQLETRWLISKMRHGTS